MNSSIEDFKNNFITSDLNNKAWNFLRLIADPSDIIEVRKLPSRRSVWFKVNDLLDDKSIIRGLVKSNLSGQDIFFGVNPRGAKGGRKLTDVPLCRCLMASFPEHYSIAKTSWISAGLPVQTAIVGHKNGCVFFGRLQEPVTISEWKELQRCLVSVTGCTSLIDATRVIHMPGFYWHSTGESSRLSEFDSFSKISSIQLKSLALLRETLSAPID